MRQASRDLFGGFELRADCKPDRDIVRYPDRFIDKRELEDGMRHWNRLMALITAGVRMDNLQISDEQVLKRLRPAVKRKRKGRANGPPSGCGG